MVRVAEYIAPDSMTSNIIGRKLDPAKTTFSRLIAQMRYATIAKDVSLMWPTGWWGDKLPTGTNNIGCKGQGEERDDPLL